MATSNTYIPRDSSLDTSDSNNTANFLPNIYKTDANKKFLHATINQLTQPGTVKKVNGYVGRLPAKAITAKDIVVQAPTKDRQYYQLEPGMVINDDMDNTLFLKDYIDYINQLKVFGANTLDHSRLNEQELYSWNPHIDWDKFVNFQDYYWLPNGPNVVNIRNSILPVDSTLSVRLEANGVDYSYVITPDGVTRNPTITLYRGCTYEFIVDSPNHKFSIKTIRSIGTANRYNPVVNNGITSGKMTLEVPVNSPDILYYVSENKNGINAGGVIRILDNTDRTYINVTDEILGKKFYTLSNGTQLSNGMCVSFSGKVVPEKFATGKFHVTGVGDAIDLIADTDLEIISQYTTSETMYFEANAFDSTPFGNAKSYATAIDYVVINRGSVDKNPWSRYNKWVHKSVIEQSAAFNHIVPDLDQSYRAVRPIIEFNKNLKLFNFGTSSIPNVSLIDGFTSDVFSIIEGSLGYSVDGVQLSAGQRVIFTADPDPLVTNNIYRVEFIDVEHTTDGSGKSNSQQIRLVLESTPEYNQVVLVTDGMIALGQMYWFNGYTWVLAQQKTSVNQSPLFDILDENFYSFGDTNEYSGSTFTGTSIFEYKVGKGTADPKLGFPLSYKNINNIGDIVFNFTLINDTFQYETLNVTQTKKIDTGFLIDINTNECLNGWTTCQVYNTQPAVRVYRNTTKTNNFDIDIFDTLPNLADIEVRVYVNGTRVSKELNWNIVSTAKTSAGTIVPLQYHRVVFNDPIKETDVVTIKVFSSIVINDIGYYEIPINLQYNPMNGVLTEFTLGEVIDHVDSIVDNIYLGQHTVQFTGAFPGISNLRDLGNLSQFGTKFVQHSGPMSLSMYHITADNNIIQAIDKSRDDYSKFKRLFVTVASTLGVMTEPKEHVDLILNAMNADMPVTSPYYFSDMIPYGAHTRTEFVVRDPEVKVFSLSKVFSLDKLSTSAVLVYLNDNQLLHGIEYTFNAQGFVELSVELAVKDEILIYEYDNTDGCFIPETPTKLGIWPKYTPKIFKDTTLISPRWMIQGHDGSLSLIYGYFDESTQKLKLDYRDTLILELEKRIYNNIKVQYDPTIFNIHDVIPGYARNNSYSLDEFNQVLLTSYYQWAVDIKQDFSTLLTQDRSNTFSFNYSSHYTQDYQTSPGYWRGIFQWMYDTDRPHICPWEMLGFSEEPKWWVEVYGPAPYTSNNTVMWDDIGAGLVKAPNESIIELPKYYKPYLKDFLPVDENGSLRSPHDSGIVVGRINNPTQGDFKFGDISPVEAAWRRSSFYSFSVIKTAILLRPSKTIGLLLDRSRITRNLAGQLIYSDTGIRINLSDIKVPSIYLSKPRIQTAGIINFLINNIDCTTATHYNQYKTNLKTLTSQLCYRVSGFTSKEKFKLLLDSRSPSSTSSNIFVPQEDYKVVLNVSSPISSMVYSGVIITKIEGGFEVKGYSTSQPYFKYYTSSTPGSFVTIGGVSASYSIWTAGQYYLKDRYVKYGDRYFNTNVSHYSSDFFEPNNFTPLADLPIIGGERVEFKEKWDTAEVTVLYGSKFTSIQSVVDFLVGYGKWLSVQGFIFDTFDADLGSVLTWEASAKEFVFWTTQNWGINQPVWSNWVPNKTVYVNDIVSYNGEYYKALETMTESVFNSSKYLLLLGLNTDGNSVLTLSPAATTLVFKTDLSTVDDIRKSKYTYEMFDVNGNPVPLNYLNSYRTDNTVSYTTKTADTSIYCAAFYLVQKEHVVVIKNTTMFNDTIYNPESGYKQDKIKVAGYVSSEWNGSLNVPGFIVDTAEIFDWIPWQDYALGDLVKHRTFYYSASTSLAGTETFNDESWVKLDYTPTPKLLPNWNYKASQFTDFYSLDSDNFDIGQQKMAQHLIGYQKRQYLENIIQDDVSEFKFYQGMIVEKGTQNVLNKLFDVLSVSDKESLTFYEEWAVRTGCYGASSSFNTVEIKLDESAFRMNPQGFEFINRFDELAGNWIIQLMPNDMYVKPVNYKPNLWKPDPKQSQLLRPCGHVRESEVSLTITSFAQYETLSLDQSVGDYIWCTFDGPSWNVYQIVPAVSKTDVDDMRANTQRTAAIFKTKTDHGLKPGEYIQIIDYSEKPKPKYDRIIYKVYLDDVDDIALDDPNKEFRINVSNPTILDDFDLNNIAFNKFESRKYINLTDLESNLTTADSGDLAWTENNEGTDGQWVTWERQPTEWLVRHIKVDRPDVSQIKQAFLYNRVSNDVITYLDVVDSANGKNPIIADREIKYKAFYDPAAYSFTDPSNNNATNDSTVAWTTEQVGTLWWDLRSAKFINSYAEDISYRNATWSTLAYGASIDVYEWVSSTLLPSEWDLEADTDEGLVNGISGKSLYGDTAYTQTRTYDKLSQRFSSIYYFWVKNKITLPDIPSRKISAAEVASLIANPRGNGYAFLALTGLNSFSLVNVKPHLQNDDVVLAIEYWINDKVEQNMHTQWKLISNNDRTVIPANIEQKWFDSLCGFDMKDREVPDNLLPIKLKYGIENRPRQSMFVNRCEVLKQLIEQTNMVLIKHLIADSRNMANLIKFDQRPDINRGLYDAVIDTDSLLRLTVAKSYIKPIINPVIVDGRITNIDIQSAGRGYLQAPFANIVGKGTGAVVRLTIGLLGEITGCDIIHAGEGYTDTTTIEVRNYAVLIFSDSTSNDGWSIYEYDRTKEYWYKVLMQSYDTTRYWSYVDWYDAGYSQYTTSTHSVNTYSDLFKKIVQIGEIVRVKTTNSNRWVLLKKYANSDSTDWTLSYKIIGSENGTIQFSSLLYDFINTSIGYEGYFYDQGVYDNGPLVELRNILYAIRDDLFIDELRSEYLNLFFTCIRAAYSEQPYIDWIFKTSFVNVMHNIGSLQQSVTYQSDNLSNFEDFVNEVKPYRTQVREYVSVYDKIDTSSLFVSDFDAPASSNLFVYEDKIISSISLDELTYPIKSWYYNAGFAITDIRVLDGGSGYKSEPTVTIESSSGQNATARAYIANGKVSRITVVTAGTGYLTIPQIKLTGGLASDGVEATAIAILGDGVVRSNLIKLKFDRINSDYVYSELLCVDSFTGNGLVQFRLRWAPDIRINYSAVTVNGISQIHDSYTLRVDTVKTADGYDTFVGSITFKKAPVGEIVISYFKDVRMLTAVDRIKFFYEPKVGDLGKELSQLMTGIDYGGVTVSGLNYNKSVGWGSNLFYTDAWDSFKPTIDDYQVTVSQNTREIHLPYVPELGSILNVYYSYNFKTQFDTDGKTLSYKFLKYEHIPDVTLHKVVKLSATINPNSNVLPLVSTTQIKVGDIVSNSNNPVWTTKLTLLSTSATHNYITVKDTSVLYVNMPLYFTGKPVGNILTNHTYYVREIRNSTEFTISSTVGGAAVTVINASGRMAIIAGEFKYDTVVESIDTTAKTVTLSNTVSTVVLTQTEIKFSRTLIKYQDFSSVSRTKLVLKKQIKSGMILQLSGKREIIRLDDINYGSNLVTNDDAIMLSHVSDGVSSLITIPTTYINKAGEDKTFAVNDGDIFIIRNSTSSGAETEYDIDTSISGGNFSAISAAGLTSSEIMIDGSSFVNQDVDAGPEEVVPGQLADALAIKVYDINDSGSYMMFKDMLNRTHLKRLNENKRTNLAVELKQTDETITVEDASYFDLPAPEQNRPGVIDINGERIEFFTITDNTLGQLRRGTLGTGIPEVHDQFSIVQEISAGETMPNQDKIIVNQYESDGTNYVDIAVLPVKSNNWTIKTTQLASELLKGEKDIIILNDASIFEPNMPGVVKINGEKIKFETIDGVALRDLTRGVDNTVIQDHSNNSVVQNITTADFGQCNNVEVIINGMTLKKIPYQIHDININAVSPIGDVQYDADFSVDGKSKRIRLTNPVPAGTLITVIQRTGTSWNTPVYAAIIDRFLNAVPGSRWI